MKRFVSVLLCLCMVLTCVTPAFAAETDAEESDGETKPATTETVAEESVPADEDEQDQCDPGDQLLKRLEILHDGVDAEPAGHRHQRGV